MTRIARRLPLAGLALLFFIGAPDSASGTDLMTMYRKALEYDPQYLAARSERGIAGMAVRESRAGTLPNLSVNAAASYTIQDIRSSDNFLFQVGETDFSSQNFNIQLVQPIVRTEVYRRMDEAKAAVRRAESTFAAAELDLMVRVAEAHLNFLAAQDALDLATAEREAIGRQREEAEARSGLGLAKMTDVHEARGRYALAQATEIQARDTLEERRQAIAEITGEAPTQVEALGENLPLVQPDSPDPDRWVEAARFQNPKVRALEAGLEVARQEVRRQRAAYHPTLDFVASYRDNDTGGSIFAGGGGSRIDTQDFEVRLAIPIYDGGRASSLISTASLRQDIAAQDLERERRAVERETRSAFQGVVSGVTRVEALRQSVFAHEAALEAKEEGWRSGVNTALAVLDARQELFRSRMDLARSRYLYVLDSLKLKQSAGSLTVRDLEQINAFLQ